MTIRSLVPIVVFGFVGAARPSLHHSVTATYDPDRLVPLTGSITRVTVVNPHVKVELNAPGPGGVTMWTVEMAPPNALIRKGFDPRSLQAGQQVTFESWLRRDGQPEATGRTLVTADGARIDVGDALGWTAVSR